jgi:hypothetical protein
MKEVTPLLWFGKWPTISPIGIQYDSFEKQ